jgi:hypothetical protein
MPVKHTRMDEDDFDSVLGVRGYLSTRSGGRLEWRLARSVLVDWLSLRDPFRERACAGSVHDNTFACRRRGDAGRP